MNIQKIILTAFLLFIFIFSVPTFASDEILLSGKRFKVITKNKIKFEQNEKYRTVKKEYKGEIIQKTSDYLLMVNPIDRARIDSLPLVYVTSLQVSQGKKSNFGNGFLYGGLFGFTLGAITGYAEGPIDFCIFGGCDPPTTSERIHAAFGFGVAFGVGFGLTGGVIGALIKTEKWEEIRKETLELSFAPINNKTLGLKLSYSF